MSSSRLAILWTSSDREVALTMAFMYARNSKTESWWDTVRLVVWGPSAEVLAMDHDLRQQIRDLRQQGVEVLACKACADLFDVADRLSSLGVTVLPMGPELTAMLKDDWKILTV
ncbi:DsrE family protein [Megalodesulfovibrio gigas]|uniref:Uncharacterized protein n=1 Tax=Megalodesulfovibrio gigas (strain ATCC 19364 / DSM 1382 / NCIMB 9332 / VKM B-1759) TaxID=1121448 RepID=T2GC07_MEGG1|nr:DsrE family protein [Megalodesulfovibrio gigas]AGW14095.1 hypothetical protein DGI_2342 [Megalodesulfovibrio gigas DSM 1382 = ATCC 19364]